MFFFCKIAFFSEGSANTSPVSQLKKDTKLFMKEICGNSKVDDGCKQYNQWHHFLLCKDFC